MCLLSTLRTRLPQHCNTLIFTYPLHALPRLLQLRNRHSSINLILVAIAICTALGTRVAGLFGMNLNSGFEQV